jgi:hypothetical protein
MASDLLRLIFPPGSQLIPKHTSHATKYPVFYLIIERTTLETLAVQPGTSFPAWRPLNAPWRSFNGRYSMSPKSASPLSPRLRSAPFHDPQLTITQD